MSYDKEKNEFKVGGDTPIVVDLYKCDSDAFGFHSKDDVVYGHITMSGTQNCIQIGPIQASAPLRVGPCSMEDGKAQIGQYWALQKRLTLLGLLKPDETPIQLGATNGTITVFFKRFNFRQSLFECLEFHRLPFVKNYAYEYTIGIGIISIRLYRYLFHLSSPWTSFLNTIDRMNYYFVTDRSFVPRGSKEFSIQRQTRLWKA